MGFLTGAFLKSYSAVQRIRLQNQLTSVTLRMQRVNRRSNDVQKQISQMKNAQTMNLKSMQSVWNQGAYAAYQSSMSAINGDTTLSDQQKMAEMQKAQSIFTMAQQQNALQASQQQAQIENSIQEFEEAQLEPLKNEEEALTLEKNAIESQIKLIEGQEQAASQMEKSSQKDFVPEYTGGGG